MAKGIPQEILHKEFAKEFVKNGLNAKQAYKTIKQPKTDRIAEVRGSELVRKPEVQNQIALLLPSDDVEAGIIHKALEAETPKDISWKDKRGFIETSLKLKGYLQHNGEGKSTNIGIFIKRD